MTVDPNAPHGSRVIEAVETTAEAPATLAFDDFYRAEYGSVARALVIVAGSMAAADELTQEAFARAYERWDRVARMRSPAGYVYRSALNLHRSRLRRASVALRHAVGAVPAPAPEPGVRHEVREMLASLPRAQREALMLVDWLGYTAEEAAGILGVRPSSVRGRLHRARRGLRERFGGDGD
jgi:RNA polymerase sigma-70 factor, ECF subfamily